MKSVLIFLALLFPIFAMADHHKKEAGAYRHVVIIKFKEDATDKQKAHISKEFAALEKKIPTITGIEWGTNVSPENHAQGYTHCFIVSFKDRAGLDVYLPHEAHGAFVKQLVPVMDKVLVVDFIAK